MNWFEFIFYILMLYFWTVIIRSRFASRFDEIKLGEAYRKDMEEIMSGKICKNRVSKLDCYALKGVWKIWKPFEDLYPKEEK